MLFFEVLQIHQRRISVCVCVCACVICVSVCACSLTLLRIFFDRLTAFLIPINIPYTSPFKSNFAAVIRQCPCMHNHPITHKHKHTHRLVSIMQYLNNCTDTIYICSQDTHCILSSIFYYTCQCEYLRPSWIFLHKILDVRILKVVF